MSRWGYPDLSAMPTRNKYPVEHTWVAEEVVDSLRRKGHDAEFEERRMALGYAILVATDAPEELVNDVIEDAEDAFCE